MISVYIVWAVNKIHTINITICTNINKLCYKLLQFPFIFPQVKLGQSRSLQSVFLTQRWISICILGCKLLGWELFDRTVNKGGDAMDRQLKIYFIVLASSRQSHTLDNFQQPFSVWLTKKWQLLILDNCGKSRWKCCGCSATRWSACSQKKTFQIVKYFPES